MKPLLVSLLVLTGCSVKRDDVPGSPVGTGTEFAGDAGDPKHPDNANQDAQTQDLGERLNEATPFSNTIADQYGIGNTTATSTTPVHQPPAKNHRPP
ncbi:MAG: hypothetical protein CMJ75_17210 [Planctomycetaceae bacterium]|nr:hypothetical protein [Planctomycetaceae bacterium]